MLADFFLGLVHTWGYLGVFVAAALANATILLPVPSFVFIIAAGAVLNPFLVAAAGGAGAAIGELTAYAAGYGGGRFVRPKNRYVARLARWFKKNPSFFAIALFSAIPFPFDVIGILCGVIKYDVKKFALAVFAGRTVLYAVLAYASSIGMAAIIQHFV